MYVEPTWVDLLVGGATLKLTIGLLTLIISYLIGTAVWKIAKGKFSLDNDDEFLKYIGIFFIFLILLLPASYACGYIWNIVYEQPSVRTETVTITDIQPLPGAVDIDKNGYYIDNANQLMFITTGGKEFANTENWMFNKFETRTIFNRLKVNGTYKIKYYGWRNGHDNQFPNILSVEETIDESNCQPNDYNRYFGANRGNRAYDVELNDYNQYGD